MPKNKGIKKSNVIGGDKSYIPTQNKGMTMSKVKMLDGKEYELRSLSSLDLKKIDESQKENKNKKDKGLSDYDMTFDIYLYAFKKFNPGLKDMTLDEFMEMFPLVGMTEKVDEIAEITGLNFKVGVGKK